MRFLLTILAIYVLALSVHPCEDSKPIIVSEVNTVMSSHAVVYEHVVLEQDICPPFCLCSCCSISIEMPYTHFYPLLNNDYSNPNVVWIKHLSDQPTFDIFQPPRQSNSFA